MSDLRQVAWFYPVIPISSINKTDRDDMSEILLKVALNTTNQPTNLVEITYFYSL